jgi:YggT family protein
VGGANEAQMVLDAIDQVELFINVFVSVYLLVVFLYVLSSWLRLPYSLNPVQRFLYDVCEPYLRLWRRILPMSFGPVDFTPMIAIFGLVAVSQILIAVLDRLH